MFALVSPARSTMAALFIFFASGLAAQDLADVIARCEKSVVRIEVKSNEGDSIGSGFIVDPSGVMITNCHVLAGGFEAVAIFENGEKYEIKGTRFIDENRDIAIAKIEGKTFPTIRLSSAAPRKGERVTALGAPKGLSFSATTGIVSAIRNSAELGIEIGRPSLQGDWIQVDAALSPGNSGGPLINAQGDVIAMSTLASQGSAQNLNFGISANDIQDAIRVSSNRPWTALMDGAANTKMADSEGPPGSPENLLPNRNISPRQVEDYVSKTRDEFKELSRQLNVESNRVKSSLNGIRAAKIPLPPGSPSDASIVRVHGRQSITWYFRSETLKRKEISRQERRLNDLKKTTTLLAKGAGDNDAIFELATKCGPLLDVREENSIGFMKEAIVIKAFNKTDVILLYEEQTFLAKLQSTAGLSLGQELSPCVMFVAGTETVASEYGIPTAVTILQEVPDSMLQKAVYGAVTDTPSSSRESSVASDNSSSSGVDNDDPLFGGKTKTSDSDAYREWHDKSGRSIEALLLSSSESEVVLKKRDGKVVKVPLSKLSEADVRYLKKD